jgi:hypothetical protein
VNLSFDREHEGYRVGANQDDWTFHLSEISRAGHTRERALAARHAL